MEKDYKSISQYWKSQYCARIIDSKKFDIPEHFKQMAGFMAPGRSYYYIANFHTLELEFLSDSVKEFVGLPPEEVDMQKLLALALPEEIEKIENKEKAIHAFFAELMKKGEVLDYKILYTYAMKDYEGKERVMLHQASCLSQNEEGRFVHVFSIHTDISHLGVRNSDDVSFIHVNGGPSYYNICTKSGEFDLEKISAERNMDKMLSGREIEIVNKMAEGFSSSEVAKKLCISSYTVQTHRKNILRKTNCRNMTQLVSKCLAAGIISPTL